MSEFIKLYEREFSTYNAIHNISRLKDIKAAAADSLLPLEFMRLDGLKIADIGSGAGFPALFLAAATPSASFVLFEPNYKKAAFLTTIAIKADLKNVKICAKKVQDYEFSKDERRFDLVTSRAFASASVVAKLCANLGDKQLRFLLFKGSLIADELGSLKTYKLHEYPQRIFLEFKLSDLLSQ